MAILILSCKNILLLGRGDIGKQYAAGALGFAIFAPIIGGAANGRYMDAMICFTILLVVAILILIFDK